MILCYIPFIKVNGFFFCLNFGMTRRTSLISKLMN